MKPLSRKALLSSGEIHFEFHRSSGPGGQNVNKVATAARLRYDLPGSRLLTEEVKARLSRLAGRRLTENGFVIIEAQRFRTRERNREDAIERLLELIRRAWAKPRERRPTKPTAASKRQRLENKRQRGEVKRKRGKVKNLEVGDL